MSINPYVTIFLLLAATSSQALSISLADPCTVSDFPALCRGTIKGQTNVNAATDMAIKELMKRTRQAKKIAEKELKRNGGVATCLSNFNSAFDNLEKALTNIKENDGFSLNINLSAALTDYDTCSDSMKETKEVNVIYKSAGVLYRMADNCLALSTLVKH
ncbi:Pectinesterase inhibitor domain [Arabidopsis suecica]|uniref:Pectinesterase inhibitor domain n=1 Tax=Arabidopsis suecica TaxID=45249 RepID=A0A8T2H524_ARASU|nr:Pectinesterase inhibitor domain [Arabidopsis suecica]